MSGTGKNSFQERLCMHFYANEEEMQKAFSTTEIPRVLRLRDLNREVLNNPMNPDVDYVRWLRLRYKIAERQAYYDLADLRVAVGTFSSLNKEFERRVLSEGLKKNMAVAEKKGDLAAYARLAKEYKSINRLDKDDPQPIDTNLVPLSARPQMDEKYLSAKFEDPEFIEKMKKDATRLWGKRLAEEADYEEMPLPQTDAFDRSQMDIEKNNPQNDPTDD